MTFIELLHFLLRLMLAATGLFLIYTGCFLYETEEGQIKSKLENFWVSVHDLEKTSIDRRVAYLREVARRTGTIIDRIFGVKLLSRRLFVVASFLLLASLAFCGGWVLYAWKSMRLLMMVFLVPVVLEAVPMKKRWVRLIVSFVTTTGLVILLVSTAVLMERHQKSGFPLFILFLLFISIGSDICTIVLLRASLRWCTRQTVLIKLLLPLGLNLIVAAFFAVPMIFYDGISPYLGFLVYDKHVWSRRHAFSWARRFVHDIPFLRSPWLTHGQPRNICDGSL